MKKAVELAVQITVCIRLNTNITSSAQFILHFIPSYVGMCHLYNHRPERNFNDYLEFQAFF